MNPYLLPQFLQQYRKLSRSNTENLSTCNENLSDTSRVEFGAKASTRTYAQSNVVFKLWLSVIVAFDAAL